MSEQVRVNKITARFEGEGVAVATLYRTHTKLGVVKSTDAKVAELGFVMPESVEGAEVTPSQKLNAFKEFVQISAAHFGYFYDPVDRRDEGNKYPNKYDSEIVLIQTAQDIMSDKLTEVLEKIAKPVEKLVGDGLLPAGTEVGCEIGEIKVDVQEKYANGNFKYADAVVPTTFTVADKSLTIDVKIELVSGQLKKPRHLGDHVFTMTGLKTALEDAQVLPKVVKPAKEENADADATGEANVAE